MVIRSTFLTDPRGRYTYSRNFSIYPNKGTIMKEAIMTIITTVIILVALGWFASTMLKGKIEIEKQFLQDQATYCTKNSITALECSEQYNELFPPLR